MLLSCTAQGEQCVVSRRLPSFGLGVRRAPEQDMRRATEFASRTRGGVCHMARLLRINNTLSNDPMPVAVYSAQACTHSNSTLTCTMLAQNASYPADSRVHVHEFAATQPPTRGVSIRTRHRHRALCSSCARANLTHVLTRLLKTVPVKDFSTQQLSFEVPHRISTERMIAGHLHRALCGANHTCTKLRSAHALARTDCLRRGH
jgi:hypothetical protein